MEPRKHFQGYLTGLALDHEGSDGTRHDGQNVDDDFAVSGSAEAPVIFPSKSVRFGEMDSNMSSATGTTCSFPSEHPSNGSSITGAEMKMRSSWDDFVPAE